MSTQLLKAAIDPQLFCNFLQSYAEVCVENDQKYYRVNKAVFKKAVFHDAIKPFYTSLKPAYHLSKQYFLERPATCYSAFTTVLRQVCNANNIPFKTMLVYGKSDYETVYYLSVMYFF